MSADIRLEMCVDSGATHVVAPFLSDLASYAPQKADIRLASKGVGSSAEGHGVFTMRSRSAGSKLTFPHALYVPSARRRLICVGKSMRSGVYFLFEQKNGGSVVVDGNGFWGHMILAGNDLLFLDAEVVKPAESQTSRPFRDKPADLGFVELSNVEVYHRRLGHPGRTAIKTLVRLQKIPPEASAPLPDHCRTCYMGKAHAIARKAPFRAVTRCLERLHIDLMCKITPVGRSGEEYLLVVTDEFSGYFDATPLKCKSAAPAAFLDLVAQWENQLQPRRVTELHSDQGKEFDNSVLDAWANTHGLTQRCAPCLHPSEQWFDRASKPGVERGCNYAHA
jgi:hypothetical protein